MTIKEIADKVRTAIYARDVREAIAQGLEKNGEIEEAFNTTADRVDSQLRQVKETEENLNARMTNVENEQSELSEANTNLNAKVTNLNNVITDGMYIKSDSAMRWTQQNTALAVSNIVKAERLVLASSGGASYFTANYCQENKKETITLEPNEGKDLVVARNKASIIKIENNESLYITQKHAASDTVSQTGDYIGESFFEISGDGFLSAKNKSEIQVQFTYVIYDVTKTENITMAGHLITDKSTLIITAGAISHNEVVAENINLNIYRAINKYYLDHQEYELIREDNLPLEISKFVINRKNNVEGFKYKDLKVVILGSNNSDLSVFSGLSDGTNTQYINASGKATYASSPIIIKYILDESGYYLANTYQGQNSGIMGTYSSEKMKYCSEITLMGNFSAGTRILLYGRRKYE